MFFPIAAIAEPFWTERTGEWLLPGVESHVSLDVTRLGEFLPTELTAGLVVFVCRNVLHGVFCIGFSHQIRIRHFAPLTLLPTRKYVNLDVIHSLV